MNNARPQLVLPDPPRPVFQPRQALHPATVPMQIVAPMALTIPAHPNVAGNPWEPRNYLEIPGIDIDLAFLDRHDLEFSVRSAWLGILDNYYTRNHRYTHDVEARNKEGYSDILVRHWQQIPHPFAQRPPPFLIIQCKRVSYEGRNSEWFGAKDQLQNYFRAIYDRYNPTNPAGGGPIPRHIYGAIAIGRFVRFYWYNTRTRRLNMLEPRPETTRWHVIDESHYVHHVLDFIRNNH
ncbi:hypothetical protein AWENTII_002792 [Aspergillus wentii]